MKRLIAAAAFGLVLGVVPLPRMTFLPHSVAALVPLPHTESAGAADLSGLKAAADQPLDGDRVQATDQTTTPFTVIGLKFDAQPGQPVLVRVKDHHGEFGPWHQLHPGNDEGPDNDTTVATEPFWVGDGAGYEVNLGAADAPAADVLLVHEEQQRTVATATPAADAANPLGIHTRGEWGARPANGLSVGSTIKMAVVHHSASSNNYSQGDVPGILRGIQAYHMDGRGWSDIGYNFVVDKFGTRWEARGDSLNSPVIGAHALGFNTNTVGVMVLGDYVAAQPTGASLEGVSQIVGWKLGMYGVSPAASSTFISGGNEKYAAGVAVNLPNVVGHRDTGSTDCPGSVENYLPQIRARAEQIAPNYRGDLHNMGAVTPFSGGFFVQGSSRDTNVNPEGPVTLMLDGAVMGSYQPGAAGAFVAGKVGVLGGYHQLCMVHRRSSDGADVQDECRIVNIPWASPSGSLDAVRQNGGRVYFAGWAFDPETTEPIEVHITYDGIRSYRSDGPLYRPDVGAYLLPGYGPAHGFEYQLDVPKGSHTMCAVAINHGGGYNNYLGCKNLVVK